MMAQLYEPYLQYKPVDNFDLSLNISEPAEPSPPPPQRVSHSGLGRSSHIHRDHYGSNNSMAVDQTFHTPSFGDEDFDLAPPTLGSLHGHPGGAQASASSAAPVAPVAQSAESPTPAAPPPHPPNTVSPESQIDCYGQQAHQMSPTFAQQSHQTQQGDGYMQPPAFPPPQHHQHQMNMQQQQQQQQQQQHQQQMVYEYNNMMAMNQQHAQQQQQMQQQMQQQQHYVQGMQILGPPPQQLQMIHVQQQQTMGHQGHHQMQHGNPHCRPGSAGSGSPPTSNHTSSPGLETGSEDSDDCTPLTQMMGGLKRPSPEPMDNIVVHNIAAMVPAKPLTGVKKPKVQKKKKKRDPNEPQKPVSAYALFFRDTQAAIKGQNPNASFGEVSKIVASMWDSLDTDHKNIYKRKTEAAKKEYLKALAAYRASLVSKAAADQSDGLYGSSHSNNNNNNNSMPPGGHGQHQMVGSGGLSPLQKKSPLLTSLMEVGGGPTSGATHFMGTNTSPANSHPNSGGHMGQHPSMSPGNLSAQQQQNHMVNMMGMGSERGNSPMGGPQQQTTTGQEQQSPPQQQQQNNGGNTQASSSPNGANPSYSTNYMNSGGGGGNAGGGNQGGFAPSPPTSSSQSSMQTCLRIGCNNLAIDSPDWDREYCSSECVVSHCSYKSRLGLLNVDWKTQQDYSRDYQQGRVHQLGF